MVSIVYEAISWGYFCFHHFPSFLHRHIPFLLSWRVKGLSWSHRKHGSLISCFSFLFSWRYEYDRPFVLSFCSTKNAAYDLNNPSENWTNGNANAWKIIRIRANGIDYRTNKKDNSFHLHTTGVTKNPWE